MASNMESKRQQSHLSRTEGNSDQVMDTQQGRFTMKPVFILMALSGCFSLPKKNLAQILLWIYNIFCLLTLLCSNARFIYQIQEQGFYSLIIICFSLQALCNILVSWKCFSPRFGNVLKSLDEWNTQVNKIVDEGITQDFARLRKTQIISVLLAVLLQLMCIVFQFINVYVLLPAPDVLRDIRESAITVPFKDTYWTRLTLSLPLSLLWMTVVNPVCFLAMVSNMILSGLKAYNTFLEAVIKKDNTVLDENIGRLRITHLNLCSIIATFDKDFRYLYANMFFWSTGMGILILYTLVKIEKPWQNPLALAVNLFYLCLFLTLLGVSSIPAVLVHEKAHEPLEMLYYTDVKGMNSEQMTQLQLFLSKLTGTHVGFTLGGIMPITKEFTLTIVGVFLTYFAVTYTL